MVRLVVFLVSVSLDLLRAIFRSRDELLVENLALRQQVATLLRRRPRPDLDDIDRALWIALRRSWPKWANALIIVKAETVARWHRERFRRHWAKISRRRGLPRIDAEVRSLIHEMATNGWGAPRIHGELLKLGFEVSEATVSRYMPRRPVSPDQLRRTRMARSGTAGLPVEHRHALHVAALPMHHRDPFDRLLVAQAQLDGATLVTADSSLDPYEVDKLRA